MYKNKNSNFKPYQKFNEEKGNGRNNFRQNRKERYAAYPGDETNNNFDRKKSWNKNKLIKQNNHSNHSFDKKRSEKPWKNNSNNNRWQENKFNKKNNSSWNFQNKKQNNIRDKRVDHFNKPYVVEFKPPFKDKRNSKNHNSYYPKSEFNNKAKKPLTNREKYKKSRSFSKNKELRKNSNFKSQGNNFNRNKNDWNKNNW